VPGATVHFRMVLETAVAEGMPTTDAETVAQACFDVDSLWPGRTKPTRHFNPFASLYWAPRYFREALAARAAGDPATALVRLGWALHAKQDSIGHGVLGLSHLRFRMGLLKRSPDDWYKMTVRARAAIERETHRMLREFIAS
jgi:hypothetical protein